MDMCCENNDWVKKCIEYEVEGPRPRSRPEDLERGCAKRPSQTKGPLTVVVVGYTVTVNYDY